MGPQAYSCIVKTFMGSILFVIFTNDIEDEICGNIFKFADDTKLFCNDNCLYNLSEDLNYNNFCKLD